MVKFGLIPDDDHHHPNSSSSSGSNTPRHFFIPILSTSSSTTTPQQVEEDVQQAGGWKDFCDYHDLHMGDFLLFRHLGSLSFDVIVFDSTTCQRKYPPLDPPFFFFDHMNTGKSSKTTTTPGQAKRADDAVSAGSYSTDDAASAGSYSTDDAASAESSSDDDDIPSNQFTTTLKHYTFSQWMLYFPVKFVRCNGLGNKTCTITFRDEKGRSWPIGLRCKKSSGQVYVCGGWRQFIRRNGLKEGNVCTFELVSRRGGTNNMVFDVRRGHH